MRPLPRIILIHSVTFYKRTGTNEFGIDTYADGVDLSFVRVEPVKQTSLKSLGEMKDDQLKLFYDCMSSYPQGVTFSAGDKVVYGGQSFAVRTVSDFSPHHVEVFLK